MLLLVLAALGCNAPAQQSTSTSSAGAEPKRGGILTLSHRGDPPGAWDTMRVTNYDLTVVAPSIFGDRNLVKNCREDTWQICPGLATSWESNKDFTEWTFKIRQGVQWHDGQPFTDQDAKFWLDLSVYGAKSGDKVRQASFSKAQFGAVKAIDIPEPGKVRVSLERPSAIYPAIIGTYYPLLMQHPKHLMEPFIQRGEVNVSPQDIGIVGTGPFKFHAQEKGGFVQVRRSERYWEKDKDGRQMPFLDGVDYIIITDPASMDAAFRTGRLDGGARGGGGYFLTPERQAAYEKTLGDRVWFATIGGGGGANLGFNVLRGPFSDVRLRRAVTLWVDRQAGLKAVANGQGELKTLLSGASPWPDPEFKTWPGYNPATKEKDRAEAKRLLAEAGVPNGFTAKYLCRKALIAQCEWFQGDLAGLGIKMELDLTDDANHPAKIQQADYDVNLPSWGGEYPEAIEVGVTTRSRSPRSGAIHEDQKIVDLFAQLNKTGEMAERQRIYREIERYFLVEQVYAVETFESYSVIPYRSHVKGLFIPQDTVPANVDYATVWLDK